MSNSKAGYLSVAVTMLLVTLDWNIMGEMESGVCQQLWGNRAADKHIWWRDRLGRFLEYIPRFPPQLHPTVTFHLVEMTHWLFLLLRFCNGQFFSWTVDAGYRWPVSPPLWSRLKYFNICWVNINIFLQRHSYSLKTVRLTFFFSAVVKLTLLFWSTKTRWKMNVFTRVCAKPMFWFMT